MQCVVANSIVAETFVSELRGSRVNSCGEDLHVKILLIRKVKRLAPSPLNFQ